MKELLDKAGIDNDDLARWLGVTPRSANRYIAGERKGGIALVLLLEYLADRPEARAWFDERARKRNRAAAKAAAE